MGRHSILTDELAAQITALLGKGNYLAEAAESVGVPRQTVYEWIARGDGRDPRGLPAVGDDGTDYAAFADAVRVASARAEAIAVDQLRKAGRQDWRAAETFLKRRFPERWGDKVRVTEEPDPGVDQSALDLTRLTTDELRMLRTLYAKAAPPTPALPAPDAG